MCIKPKYVNHHHRYDHHKFFLPIQTGGGSMVHAAIVAHVAVNIDAFAASTASFNTLVDVFLCELLSMRLTAIVRVMCCWFGRCWAPASSCLTLHIYASLS